MKDIQAVIARLKALSTAVAEQNWSEFTMRVPAEPNRDADIVLHRSAQALERLEIVEQQLANREKQIVLLREIATIVVSRSDLFSSDQTKSQEALAATQDLSGYILCDAEPAWYEITARDGTQYALTTAPTLLGHTSEPLYKARKP